MYSKTNSIRRLISLITFLLPLAIFGQSLLTRSIEIKPQLSFQNYEHFKRLTLDSPNSEAEYVAGFDFEWGYDYVIEVVEEKMASTLSDGSRYNYSFKRIISKQAVPDSVEFRLHLDGKLYYYDAEEDDETLIPLNDSTFVYMEDVEIEVPAELLPEFNRIVAGEHSRNGEFKFINGSRIRLLRFR